MTHFLKKDKTKSRVDEVATRLFCNDRRYFKRSLKYYILSKDTYSIFYFAIHGWPFTISKFGKDFKGVRSLIFSLSK